MERRSAGGVGPIVVEVPEPEAEPLDVLDDQVGARGGGVGERGAVPAQDRCLPAGDGAGDCSSSGTSGQVGGADLALGVARVEPGENPGEAGRIEPVVAGQEPPTDPVERVSLVAPMPEGVVLHSAADLVEPGVGEADHVEVVDYQPGGGQSLGDGGGARL
jgi:hypothetical protein